MLQFVYYFTLLLSKNLQTRFLKDDSEYSLNVTDRIIATVNAVVEQKKFLDGKTYNELVHEIEMLMLVHILLCVTFFRTHSNDSNIAHNSRQRCKRCK